MTYDEERKLCNELDSLRSKYVLGDKSEENLAIGRRIREIRKELGTICEPHKNRVPPRVRYR